MKTIEPEYEKRAGAHAPFAAHNPPGTSRQVRRDCSNLMRRPIQIQLLVPTLSVVVLAIALASGASGYFTAMRQRQTQEESLRRVVSSLTRAPSRSPTACCGR